MTNFQRQSAFNRFFVSLAKSRAERLGLGYAGTIRKLPPPALPGEPQGATRYYLNAVASDGSRSGLVELAGIVEASLRKAESWVETGKGEAPAAPKVKTLKRKV
jgi:hypothetical protein